MEISDLAVYIATAAFLVTQIHLFRWARRIIARGEARGNRAETQIQEARVDLLSAKQGIQIAINAAYEARQSVETLGSRLSELDATMMAVQDAARKMDSFSAEKLAPEIVEAVKADIALHLDEVKVVIANNFKGWLGGIGKRLVDAGEAVAKEGMEEGPATGAVDWNDPEFRARVAQRIWNVAARFGASPELAKRNPLAAEGINILSEMARTRLAPELQAFVEGRSPGGRTGGPPSSRAGSGYVL